MTNIKFTQDLIDSIESANPNISVEFDFQTDYAPDTFVSYSVMFEGAELFKVCISQIVFESGKVDLDYTLSTYIESDCFQTADMEEFRKVVIAHIKEVV